MKVKILLLALSLISFRFIIYSQVPIINYGVNGIGQVQLSIQAQADKYYVLHAQHSPTFQWVASITMGVNGTMVISEPGAAYPIENYTITEHSIASPGDIDGDGINDITEFNNMPTDAPINFAEAVSFVDGSTSIPTAQTFMDLATVNNVPWAPFLDGQLYVKFGILDRDTPEPKIYFINSNTHMIHANFFSAIGADVSGDDSSGEIVYNPNVINPNGVIGSYSFNFSFGNAYDFASTQRTYELLVANMPFLQNNMNHFIGQNDEILHNSTYAADFVGSRIEVVLESEVFAEINYIPLHLAEGYGYFRHMTLDETPGSRDIVLYDALPNSLPRVGGIITSVIQTPLSHVNLRAIQDNVPNAYIKNPLLIDSINNLLGGYIYYKVENETFQIREATLAEVNAWYENLRPTEPQIPIRDLSITQILPLDSIEFAMSSSFGAKCANVATMRTFGFPEGTIPNGFGIPFYYYDQFMIHNNFYEEAEVMINNPAFINDINFRTQRLNDFRTSIKNASMPQWMMDELQNMQNSFPVGTSIRCRSSTNNEDLPGFSGAGLYTSKTQHPEEGHIAKSIKQIYASMWNFRAFEERDFYRVDHFVAAMGILCHPNTEGELSNGVGISIDPIYNTEGTYYLNTQVGESLITNPDPNSIPEEILLYQNPNQGSGYLVLRLSNLVNPGELVLDQEHLDQMRDYLTVIHNEFAILYDVVGAQGFGMDIEYKVTSENQLFIKQARPWVSFWANIKGNYDLGVSNFVSPQSSANLGSNELVSVNIANNGLNDMYDFNLSLFVNGQLAQTMFIADTIKPFNDQDFQFSIPQDFSTIGSYQLTCIVNDNEDEYGNNDTLNFVLEKLHILDGEIMLEQLNVVCDNQIVVDVKIENLGETPLTSIQIEVVVNGLVIETLTQTVDIPSQEHGIVSILVSENLNLSTNNITFNLISTNNQVDGNTLNNSFSTSSDLTSDFNNITLIVTPDQYPNESSWKIVNEVTNQVVSTGALQTQEVYIEEICLDYGACYSIYFYDSYGDGICCSYGMGNFQVLNETGNVLVNNNGDFGSEAHEVFCPDGTGCAFTANVNVSNTSSFGVSDGQISINTIGGLNPFQYSINGGQTYVDTNVFSNLAAGIYNIVIQSSMESCSYQETITISSCLFNTVEINAVYTSTVVTANGSITINPTSGVGPYLYSIDGGQNFVETNTFLNLATGTYNVVVQDAAGICEYEQAVLIGAYSSIGIEENILSNEVKIYPNPTKNSFNILYKTASNMEENLNFIVYDNLGRTIHSGIISKENKLISVSLESKEAGTYFVKCYNAHIETHFKVVKL
ncbi:MAG: T9SS type A sorting domain-containing protein [Flavobacteriia bacterium]|nr:T9SS type A sorting domain-containing protein [Flavobacteriia bacterium]